MPLVFLQSTKSWTAGLWSLVGSHTDLARADAADEAVCDAGAAVVPSGGFGHQRGTVAAAMWVRRVSTGR